MHYNAVSANLQRRRLAETIVVCPSLLLVGSLGVLGWYSARTDPSC